MRVLHILTGLKPGGAEIQMARLLAAVDRNDFQFHVVSLTDLGPVADMLRAEGIPVTALDMSRGSLLVPLAPLRRLRGLMDEFAPDLVQTWMYHANLIGGVVNRMGRRRPLIWSIRQTNIDVASIGWRTALVARCGAAASYLLPDLILYNANVSRQRHESAGYRSRIAEVIPNGFDTDALRPSPEVRQAVRQELGIAPETILIGMMARYDPQKDHANFVAAAGRVAAAMPEVRFLLAGGDVDESNPVLGAALEQAGVRERTFLLGHRPDVPRLLAALDIGCLSSLGEGFPNAVGEAMAMALPCVATDVGDCRYLVGETGRIVPPRNPEALGAGLLELACMPESGRRQLGEAARRRISDEFSMSAVVDRYHDTWQMNSG